MAIADTPDTFELVQKINGPIEVVDDPVLAPAEEPRAPPAPEVAAPVPGEPAAPVAPPVQSDTETIDIGGRAITLDKQSAEVVRQELWAREHARRSAEGRQGWLTAQLNRLQQQQNQPAPAPQAQPGAVPAAPMTPESVIGEINQIRAIGKALAEQYGDERFADMAEKQANGLMVTLKAQAVQFSAAQEAKEAVTSMRRDQGDAEFITRALQDARASGALAVDVDPARVFAEVRRCQQNLEATGQYSLDQIYTAYPPDGSYNQFPHMLLGAVVNNLAYQSGTTPAIPNAAATQRPQAAPGFLQPPRGGPPPSSARTYTADLASRAGNPASHERRSDPRDPLGNAFLG